MICAWCRNEMSAFEIHHMELFHPNKQLCRPCGRTEKRTPSEPLTAEQIAINEKNLDDTINRLLALASQQNEIE